MVLGVSIGILVAGFALGTSIHLVQIAQVEDAERSDFLASVELLSQLFDTRIQATLYAVPLVQHLSNQTNGPPALTRASFDRTFSLVTSTFPTITSISYSTVLLESQLETWPCTPTPVFPQGGFLANQSRFVVTTFLEQGLGDFECRDLYSNTPLYDTIIDKERSTLSIISFNPARDTFSHFIVVAVPGSQNAVNPALQGSSFSMVSPLDILFEPIRSNPSIYVQVNVNETLVFETSPRLDGPSDFLTCRPIPLFLPDGSILTTWTLCFQGSEDVFRQFEERRSILLISVLIGATTLGVICFGFYVDLAGQKRTEAAGTSQRQIASWVCHDMRAPLARLDQKAMMGTISKEDLTKELHKMQAVVRNVLEIDRLVLGILDTSNADTGKPFHLESWMDDFLRDLLPPAPLTVDVYITSRFSAHMYLCVDEDRLAQILTNLLHNASKHSTNGQASIVFDMDTKHHLFVHISNPGNKPLPPPSTLYKPPPNYKDNQKLFASKPSHVLRAFVWDTTYRSQKRVAVESVPSNYSSVGWGLTIVKMLTIGLGGDFFIDFKDGIVNASFYLPSLTHHRTGLATDTHLVDEAKSEV